MGTVKDILEFFVTFGIIDNIIIYMFFRKFGNCPKNKWYQIGALALIGSVMKFVFAPIIYQVLLFLIFIIYNSFVNKFDIKYNLKITSVMFLFILISEISYIMILDFIFNIDLSIFNNLNRFIFLIPNRFLNILLIKEMKKWDLFGLEKSKKK